MSCFNNLPLSRSFADLGPDFSTSLAPQGLNQPRVLHVNQDLAQRLGLSHDCLNSPEFLAVMSGNQALPNGQTIAAVYSGHQFGHWAGQLGDGRAHLLGAIETDSGPLELQLKGSGLTPYSRMGDGRAVLRSSLREYLASHAMKALRIPTTEALSLVASDDKVYRETIETAAIVCRVAPSFVRFGSFEHWATKPEQLIKLLHYVIKQFYPECGSPILNTDAELVQQMLRQVVRRSAQMVAHWQTVGFCHGVMNTDNMSILGLTIDYGPYAFMDSFAINFVPNTTDTGGRYAWFRQPSVVHWNLARLASCFLDICTEEQLQAVLAYYEKDYLAQYHWNMRQKMGWDQWLDTDSQLVNEWWQMLHDHQADFSLSYRRLAQVTTDPEPWLELFNHSDIARNWLQRYLERSQQNRHTESERVTQMNRHNPLYVLRNHLAQQAIEAAQQGDLQPLMRLFTVLSKPFDEQEGAEDLALPPDPEQRIVALSCSS